MPIPRPLAERLHRLHGIQERQETQNLLDAGLGPVVGVQTRTWPSGAWSVRCGSLPEHQPGNQILGLGPQDLDALPEVLAWFAEVGARLHVRWPAIELEAARDAFARAGMHAFEVETWMAAPLSELELDAAPHDIIEVSSAPDVEPWLQAFYEGWQIADEDRQAVVRAAMGPFPGPESWRRYLARVDGEPAGEALLVQFEDVAYLAEAATVPRSRRRGIQRALIARRLDDARAAGARFVFGGVEYGDASWSNMRAMGLLEESITVTFRGPG